MSVIENFLVISTRHESLKIANCALLAVRNILAGTNEQTDAVIACDVIQVLIKLLSRDNDQNFIKNICFAFSNIAASSKSHLVKIISENVCEKLAKIFHSKDSSPATKIEILHVFCNIATNDETCCWIMCYLGSSFIEVLYSGLNMKDNKALVLSLEALEGLGTKRLIRKIPKKGKRFNQLMINSLNYR